MPYNTESILEGARILRVYLPELLGDEALQVDHELATLLEQARRGQKVDTRILELVSDREPTRQWMRAYLTKDSQTDRIAFAKGFDPAPGDPTPIPAERYVCPVDGLVEWYKAFEGEPIPMCGEHKIQLVRVKP